MVSSNIIECVENFEISGGKTARKMIEEDVNLLIKSSKNSPDSLEK